MEMNDNVKEDITTCLKLFGYTIPTDPEQSEDVWKTLNYTFRRTVQYVKNFCNINAVPDGLLFYVVDMTCADFLFILVAAGTISRDVGLRPIQSITEGDVSYSFADTNDDTISYDKCIQLYRKGKLDDLLRYRKIPRPIPGI